jgi:L-2-hydroxyglutarate oxidase
MGVHSTRMIKGGVKAGATAVLVLKKECYRSSDFYFNVIYNTLSCAGFQKLILKYGKIGIGEFYRTLSKVAFTKALQSLVPGVREEDEVDGGWGIRPQACSRSRE